MYVNPTMIQHFECNIKRDTGVLGLEITLPNFGLREVGVGSVAEDSANQRGASGDKQ